MAEILASALPTPAAGDGATDDSAAFNSAVAGTTILVDGTKTYMVTNLTLQNNVTIRGTSGAAKLKKVAGSTTTYMFNLTGTNQKLENLTIDGNSVIQTTSNKFLLFGSGATNLQIIDTIWTNTGSPDKSMGAILIYHSTARISGNRMIDSTILGVQIKIDGQAGKHVVIENNELVGSQDNGIYVTNTAGGYTTRSSILPIEVRNNYIASVTDAFSGTGQHGNAIVVFQADSVHVHHNRCISPRFSGVRVDLCADVAVYDNHVDGAQESSMYAELGAISCRFYNNQILNGVSGINLTNVSQRSPDERNFAYNNRIVNMTDYGISVEHDAAWDNQIEGCVWPIRVGFGAAGHDNIVRGNIITWDNPANYKPVCGIALDKNLTMSAEKIRLNLVGTTSTGYHAMAVSISDGANFSAITAANPMVATRSQAPSPGFAVGQVYVFYGITGMVELNGKLGTVTAVNGTGITFNIDSSGFSAFTTPTGGQTARATMVYSSGTTLARTNSNF